MWARGPDRVDVLQRLRREARGRLRELRRNASEEDPAVVLRALGNPRVRLVRNETNLGSRGNWNRCLALADGEYVAMCHDDDVYEPTFIEECARLAALRGDSAVAAAELRRAHALYVEIGAAGHAERLRKELAS